MLILSYSPIFDQKLSKKGAYTSSISSSNLNIELRTSRTLLPSPKVELYELEHLKKVELRTRTQVRSTTSQYFDMGDRLGTRGAVGKNLFIFHQILWQKIIELFIVLFGISYVF